jgi:AraC family transcriptional regulator
MKGFSNLTRRIRTAKRVVRADLSESLQMRWASECYRNVFTVGASGVQHEYESWIYSETAQIRILPTAKREFVPLDVAEVAAPRGHWILPAVDKVRLGLILSDYSANWHSSKGLLSIDVNAGSLSICEFNQPRRMEMRNPTNVALVLLQNEILEQALHNNNRQPRIELQERHGLQDHNMRHLMEILLYEKRQDFPSGAFFLDSIAAALASHLIHYYSAGVPLITKFVAGMAPSTLRRCIALIEARLEEDLRLSELACEAGLSTSHFIRSFRQSTGKTPYQFLLDWRVQRAQTLLRDPRASLSEIARSTGFADQHHLARVFRRITGITPSTYRRSL